MKIKYKDHKYFFDILNEDMFEWEIDREEDYRRGSSFYVSSILEILEEYKEYFPEIDDFTPYLGFWKTNTIMDDKEWGTDEKILELTKVEKVEKQVTTYEWKEVE